MQYMSATPVPACQGRRLRPESLAVKVNRRRGPVDRGVHGASLARALEGAGP